MASNFFGFNLEDINSHIQALRGYFPISQKGKWHSGIHLTNFGDNNKNYYPVGNPLVGKIVACNLNFEGNKKDNYFLLKNNLIFPTESGNEKIDFYSLITHLPDYSYFEKIKNKNIFSDLDDEEKERIFNQPELPFCYRAVVKTDLQLCKYFEIPSIGYLSEFSEIYVNRSHTLIGKKGVTSPYLSMMNAVFSKENTEYMLFEDFITNTITIDKNTILEKIGDSYKVNSLNLTTNQYLENKYGFVEVNPKNITYNGWCSRENCNNKYYSVVNSISSIFNTLILIKENSLDILNKAVELVNRKIAFQKEQVNIIRTQPNNALYVKGVENGLTTLENEKSLIYEIKRNYQNKGLLLIENPSAIYINQIMSRIGVKVTTTNALSSVYIVPSYSIYTNLNIKEILKNYDIPYFDSFEKCCGLKEEEIPEPYSLQMQKKIPNKSNDLKSVDISDSLSVCYECRLHLVQGSNTTYTVKLNIPDDKLFFKTEIGSLQTVECGKRNCSYVYSTNELEKLSSELRSEYFTKYKEPSVDWVSKEYEVYNFKEVIEKYKECDINDDILCQISYGYVPIKKSDLKISIKRKQINSNEISSNDDLIGVTLGKNEILTYVKKDDFIDWGIFFTENILSKKTDLIKVDIKETDNIDCEKRKGREKLYNTFLPINTEIEFDKSTEGNDYKKIDKISFIIYAYSNNEINLKKNICQDTIDKIFFYGSQIWINEKKLEFFKKYTNNSGETVDTLSKFNKQNPGCKISTKEDENYQKLESFMNTFILCNDGIFGKKFEDVSGDSYKQYKLTYTADDVCNKLGINGPIYIFDKDLSYFEQSTTLREGGLFDLYSDDSEEIIKCKLPREISMEYKEGTIEFQNKKYIFDFENEKYQINEEDFNKYSKNCIEEYFDTFINFNFDKGKKKSFLDTDNCPNDSLACKLKEIKDELNNKEFFKNKKLLATNSNLLYEKDIYKTIIREFISKIIAYHPLELSEADHSKIQNQRINNWLVPQWDETINDVYKDLSETFIEKNGFSKEANQFYFVYPPDFMDKMEELKLIKINPYEGKSYESIYGYDAVPPGIDKSQPVIDNPGFATEHEVGGWSKNPNTNGYGAVTGFFNQFYENLGPHYFHEGVDFRGKVNTKVISLIHAKVIAYGWMPDSGYGQTVWLYNVDDEGVYLLAHLNSYDKKIAVGKEYFPGDIVAYVGGSGHGKLNYWDPHLHLSYYKKDFDNDIHEKRIVYTNNSNICYGDLYNSDFKATRRDPFNHNSIGHKGF